MNRPEITEADAKSMVADYARALLGPAAPSRYALTILAGLSRRGMHVYAGTVPADEVARRRARNRRARAARRLNRAA